MVSLPHPTPFMLTSCVRQRDHMRRGRAIFLVGPSALVRDAAKIGIKPPTSVAREQRKLAAILAADVVGYSRLMGRDESGTLARLTTL